jgi:DHA2 family multidrug resistance protein
VLIAMPRRPIDRDSLHRTDWVGIIFTGIGFGLIYAGLDQGNRLDWFNSGVITGLLLAADCSSSPSWCTKRVPNIR